MSGKKCIISIESIFLLLTALKVISSWGSYKLPPLMGNDYLSPSQREDIYLLYCQRGSSVPLPNLDCSSAYSVWLLCMSTSLSLSIVTLSQCIPDVPWSDSCLSTQCGCCVGNCFRSLFMAQTVKSPPGGGTWKPRSTCCCRRWRLELELKFWTVVHSGGTAGFLWDLLFGLVQFASSWALM